MLSFAEFEIVLVDDVQDNLDDLVPDIEKALACKVRPVLGYLEAKQMLIGDVAVPSVVVLDVGLPLAEQSLEICRLIRSDPRFDDVELCSEGV